LKGGIQVSPVISGIIIVIVIAIVGFFVYRYTGPRGRVQLSPEQVKQMQQMMGQRPPGVRGPVSTPPAAPAPGDSVK
jgi:hypothetical protein